MIKASELRIGNLLGWETEHRSGPIFKVVAIGEEKFEMESCIDRMMDRQDDG